MAKRTSSEGLEPLIKDPSGTSRESARSLYLISTSPRAAIAHF